MIEPVRQAFSLLDRGSRPWLVLHFVMGFVAAFLEASGLGLVFAFFQVALDTENFGGVEPLRQLHVWLGSPPAPRFLILLSLMVIAAFVLRSLIIVATSWIALAVSRRMYCQLTALLFRAYLAQPVIWHFSRGVSQLVNNVVRNVGAAVDHVVIASLDMAGAVIVIVFLLLTMSWLRPVETMLVCALLGGTGALYLLVVQKRVSEWGRRNVAAQEDMWRTATEPLRGIKTVKVAGLEEYFARAVDRGARQVMDVKLLQGMAQQIPRHILELLLVAGIMLAVAVAFGRGQAAEQIVPTMVLFAAAAIRLLPQITKIIQNLQWFRFAAAAVSTLRAELAWIDPEIKLQSLRTSTSRKGFAKLSLQNVSFTYPDAGLPAVRGINLEIQRGELVALAGTSGAGKTTLADILLGLVHPDSGTLLIDGAPVQPAHRHLFAYVPQDPFIIHDTLKRNVALGSDDSDIDEDRVKRAIAGAALGGVVERLPRGLETVMGENGAGLSGGEKQRLGIARSLYRNAEILVMDEPTSALDALTEAEVSQAITALRGQKTVILIAHRLSTVKAFDRIVFMEGGEIATVGTFAELYRLNKRFRAMVDFLSVNAADESADVLPVRSAGLSSP